jgi:WD40 repeat protein
MRPIRVVLVLGILILSAFAKPIQHDAPKDVHGDPLPPKAFARLGTKRFRVAGPVTAARFLDGGSKILVKARESQHYVIDATYHLFDAQTGRELHRFNAHNYDTAEQQELAFDHHNLSKTEWSASPDGRLLARTQERASKTGTGLQIKELATGKVVFAIEDAKHRFFFPLFSPDNQSIAVIALPKEADGLDKPVIRLWDIRAQKEVRDFALPAQAKEPFQPLLVAFSPNGAYLAASGHGTGKADRIYVWEVGGKKPPWSLDGQPQRRPSATPVAFSPDGKTMATVQRSKLGLWDAATGKQLKELAEFSRDCGELSFSPDGQRLVACGQYDHNKADLMRLWDLAADKEINLPERCAVGCFF